MRTCRTTRSTRYGVTLFRFVPPLTEYPCNYRFGNSPKTHFNVSDF